MRHGFHLVLILAVTFAAFWAPMGVSANVNDMQMVQMEDGEAADQSCDGCVSTRFADGILCGDGCTVPCGAGAPGAFVAPEASSGISPIALGALHAECEQLTLPGTFPALDPFPPKLPV